ncbi:protein NLP8-like, partial [Trifolium medium]|nr:protein NLP8-like [Trifolium medium]
MPVPKNVLIPRTKVNNVDGGINSLVSEDMPSSFSELMNFDTYAG